MSDNVRQRKPASTTNKPASGAAAAGDDNATKARQAMLKRSRKPDSTMSQYYIVIGAFVGICVISVFYVLLNPKKSFAQMPVIDESAILVHNGQQSNAFQRGENQFFQNWTISNVKSLFGNSLADSSNVAPCKSKELTSEDMIIPQSFDWRQQFPQCVQEAKSQGNCSASYAVATLSMVQDRICMQTNRTVELAA
jgi:hypothetical protein